MLDLIFDTETTGFARFKDPWEHPDQPHIVQIAARLVENDKLYGEFQAIVNTGVASSEGALKTHGITEEVRKRVGISILEASRAFAMLLDKSDRLVAHNMKFDIILVGAMFHRSGLSTVQFIRRPKFCTMHALTPIMTLPGPRGGYKWPKLEEAYKAYVDPDGFEGAHDAMADVIACEQIFKVCKEMGIVPDGEKP